MLKKVMKNYTTGDLKKSETSEASAGLLKRFQKDLLILTGAVLIAFALRLTTFIYPYLGTDEFLYYRIAQYLLESGEFPYVWPFSAYPDGAPMDEPILLYYLPVYAFSILGILGYAMPQTFKLVSPIFGAAVLIPTYLIAREIGDRKTALYAIFILAVLPAFLSRSLAGYYRGELPYLFFMLLGFYFFLKAVGDRGRILFAGFSGFFMGVSTLFWNGFLFGFIVLSGFTVAYSAVSFINAEKKEKVFKAIFSYAAAAVIGLMVMEFSFSLYPRPASQYAVDLARYIIPATLLLSGVFAVGISPFKTLSSRKRSSLLAGVAAVSSALIYIKSPGFVSKLLTGYGGVIAGNPVYQTIVELKPLNYEAISTFFGIASLFIAAGFIVLLQGIFKNKNKNKQRIFLLIWGAAGVYLMINAVRYSFIASAALAIIAAVALRYADRKLKTNFSRRRHIAPLVIFVLAIQGTGYSSEIVPLMTWDMYQSLEFLKTQEEGAVLSWWAYGSWIQGITGFPTTVDTVHGQSLERIKEISRFFLEKEEAESLELLRKYRVKYVLVSTEMIAKIHLLQQFVNDTGYYYNVAPFSGEKPEGLIIFSDEKGRLFAIKKVYGKENGKLLIEEYEESPVPFIPESIYISRGEVRIPGFPPRSFVIYIPPKLDGALLTSLMLLDGKGFPSYELIYSNQEVKIYRVKYD